MTDQAMRFEEADIDAARGVLGSAVSGRETHVVTLTDEQVLVLDGVQHEQIVPLPWLDEQGDVDRELVGKVALRALISQGHVVPAPGGPGEDVGIEAVPVITGTLVLRRTAQAILAAERVTSIDRHWTFLYVHDDEGILEEQVSASGHHTFHVYRADHLGERMAPYLDPTSAATGERAASRSFTPAEFEAAAPSLPELADATSVTSLSVVRAGTATLVNVTVYAGPAGVFVLRGDERDASGAGSLTLAPVNADEVRSLPLELVAP